MKISVMTLGFHQALYKRDLTFEGVLRCCKDAGADGVEPFGDLILERMDRAKSMFDRHGLSIPCFDIHVDLIHPDRRRRAEAAEELVKYVRLARHFDAWGLMIVPGGLVDSLTFDDAVPMVVDGIEHALPLASELGITLMIEQAGYEGAFCRTWEELATVTRAITLSNFGLCFDGGNSVLNGEDPLRMLARMAHRVKHVHFKDCSNAGGYYQSAVLGDGVVPIKEMVAILKEHGYPRYLSVEHSGAAGSDPCDEARRGVDYLRSLLDSP